MSSGGEGEGDGDGGRGGLNDVIGDDGDRIDERCESVRYEEVLFCVQIQICVHAPDLLLIHELLAVLFSVYLVMYDRDDTIS